VHAISSPGQVAQNVAHLCAERAPAKRRTELAERNATAAVVGGCDFIGAAIAKKFAAEGFTIFAGRRNADTSHLFEPSQFQRRRQTGSQLVL
jgi:hypothetical protein